MWIQFFEQYSHFALNVIAALVFFSAAWLYFDAGIGLKSLREKIRAIGFFLFSLSLLLHAGHIESSFLSSTVQPSWFSVLGFILHTGGYLCIFISLILEPLMFKPNESPEVHTEGEDGKPLVSAGFVSGSAVGSGVLFLLLNPLLAFTLAFLYFRRAVEGLEAHIKPMGYVFVSIGVSELLAFIQTTLANVEVVAMRSMVLPFGPLWFTEHLILLAAVLILGKWVFGYLLLRFETQLFMIFTNAVVVIFLMSTLTLTALVMGSLMDASYRQLTTDARVMDYAIGSIRSGILSNVQSVAGDPTVMSTLESGDRQALADISTRLLLVHKKSSLAILDSTGKVLARGEDKNQYGENLASDPLVAQALAGKEAVSVVAREGVFAPEVLVRAVVPIQKDQRAIGAVIEEAVLDNAFVGGIKKSTGLEVTLVSGGVLSATTLSRASELSSPVGSRLDVTRLTGGKTSAGRVSIGTVMFFGQPYMVAALPLTDVNNNTVGMLVTGAPQALVLSAAGGSIEISFWIMIALTALSIVPSLIVSRSIASQVQG